MKNNDTFRFIQALSHTLFQAEDRRNTRSVDELFQSNRRIIPNHGDGFTFSGEVFRPSHAPTRGKLFYTPLHPSLTGDVLAFLADRDSVRQERKLMEQIFFKLLVPCMTSQDCRDALPDCLQDVLPSIQLLSRTRPEAYTLTGDERAIRQYEQIFPRIQFYSAVRLIY